MQAKRCVSALRGRQPPGSIASCSRRRQFAVAEDNRKGDPRLKIAGNLANVDYGRRDRAVGVGTTCTSLAALFQHPPSQAAEQASPPPTEPAEKPPAP